MEHEKTLDDGPVFRRQRRWLTWGKSNIILDIIEWHALGAVELILHINWQDRYQALKLELPIPVLKPCLQVCTPGAIVERPLDGNEWFYGEWLMLSNSGGNLLVVSDGASAYDSTSERLRLTLLRCVPYAQHRPILHPKDSPAPFLDEGFQQARFWLTMPNTGGTLEDLHRLAAGLLNPFEQMLDNGHPGYTGGISLK